MSVSRKRQSTSAYNPGPSGSQPTPSVLWNGALRELSRADQHGGFFLPEWTLPKSLRPSHVGPACPEVIAFRIAVPITVSEHVFTVVDPSYVLDFRVRRKAKQDPSLRTGCAMPYVQRGACAHPPRACNELRLPGRDGFGNRGGLGVRWYGDDGVWRGLHRGNSAGLVRCAYARHPAFRVQEPIPSR